MPTKKENKSSVPSDKLAFYEALVKTIPNVERKGDKIPYTSFNGNMFSSLENGTLALRLSEEDREEFMKKYKANLMVSYGVVRKEYVAVPDNLLENTKELKKYFKASYDYVKSLRAKPTTRKKTK
jgi:TfoX/Sxy family transcriptional regulator of competence genes